MTASPYFSIIIVNFQSASQVEMLLKTLFATEQERGLFEVIVVNNDIRESQALCSLAATFPIQSIETEMNIGFGRAANEALPLIHGTVIGFVNPDTRWQEPFLQEAKDFFEKQTVDTVVGVKLVTPAGKEEPWSKGVAPTFWELMVNNLSLQRLLKRPDTIDWVSGGSLFLPKDLFSRLRGFDLDFFLYFEDVDLCIRAKKLGADVRVAPFGTLVHSGGKSFSSPIHQKKAYYTSQLTYFQKHRSKREYRLVRILHQIFHAL